jgi:hypothetical protein
MPDSRAQEGRWCPGAGSRLNTGIAATRGARKGGNNRAPCARIGLNTGFARCGGRGKHARVVAAGFEGEKEPWDAFWGQRYALLGDPDGVRVNLYAALT